MFTRGFKLIYLFQTVIPLIMCNIAIKNGALITIEIDYFPSDFSFLSHVYISFIDKLMIWPTEISINPSKSIEIDRKSIEISIEISMNP